MDRFHGNGHGLCTFFLFESPQIQNLCYGLNLLPVQIFLNWFVFFRLVHIF